MKPNSGLSKQEPFEKILLIICDQFRFPRHWGDLMDNDGSLNEDFFPNYARMRKSGREFKRAYIASSACNASRACIYTGKYSQETEVTSTSGFGNEAAHDASGEVSWMGYHPYDPQCSLPSDDVIKTLGTHFRGAGYRAIYKGKWHLSEAEGGWPNRPYDAEGLAKFGFEGWNPPEGHGNSPLRWGMGADVSYVQDAANTLYELKDTNYKWFMAVNLINPHDVGFFRDWAMKVPDFQLTQPPNFETLNQLRTNKPLAQSIGRWYWNYVTFMPENLNEIDLDEDKWAAYANYYAHLAQIADFNIGILLDTLESTGQLDDTMVVFLSDHGEMGGSHGLTQKWYQAYEETIHVPLVFSSSRITDGPTDSLASMIDIAPTLLELAGIDLPTGKDELRGESLVPILIDPNDKVQDEILFVTDDDSVGSVVDLEGKLSTFTPLANSSWEGERPAERKFREGFVRKLQKDLGVDVQDILNTPRHVRAMVTHDGYKLVCYTLNDTSPSEHIRPGTIEYELYDLNDAANRMEETNLVQDGNIAADYDAIFQDLKGRLNRLLDKKYYHSSMRECEPTGSAEE